MAGFAKRVFFFFVFFFFDYKAKVANELLGGALLGPRGMICMIYIKLHTTILHTKY